MCCRPVTKVHCNHWRKEGLREKSISLVNKAMPTCTDYAQLFLMEWLLACWHIYWIEWACHFLQCCLNYTAMPHNAARLYEKKDFHGSSNILSCLYDMYR
jgi:hypothetical protein